MSAAAQQKSTPAPDAARRGGRKPMVWEVIREVSRHYDEPVEAILGDSRRRRLCFVRHVAMYLAHESCGKSLPQLAAAFQRQDHTTVMHAIRRVEAAMESDKTALGDMATLRARLRVRMMWGIR